jgi:predicted ABC-type ATPase
MTKQKRMRIFAGPNGSGKSSILKIVAAAVPLGVYINSDDLDRRIKSEPKIDLNDFGIRTTNTIFQSFLSQSEFAKEKSVVKELNHCFAIGDNKLCIKNASNIPLYSSAIISDFLREENLKAGNDFSFETVLSHSDKIQFIRRANASGYHTYLYFICTDDVRVNLERVKSRVKGGGHSVPIEKIKTRYFRSLELLYDALSFCYKSYLFDNSNQTTMIIRINRDKNLDFLVKSDIPGWILKYVIEKAQRSI